MEREYTSPRDFCLPRAMTASPHRTPAHDADNAAQMHTPPATHPAKEPSPVSAPISRASIAAPRAAALPCKDAAARAILLLQALPPQSVPRTSPPRAPPPAPPLPDRA